MPERYMSAIVVTARVLEGFQVELGFSDGVTGVVDLSAHVLGRGGVFEPLKNPQFFRRVAVNEDLGTIVWPNDVDFCPDVLYSMVTGKPVPFAEPDAVVR